MLAQKNPVPREQHVQFDEKTHTYVITVDPDHKYDSATSIVHSFFPEFDPDVVISKMRRGRNWNPQNKYFNMTDQEIKDGWEQNRIQAASDGTFMHNNIENTFNHVECDPKFLESKEYDLFQRYLNDHNYRPFRTELRVYCEIYKIAGSIDMIYHDPNNSEQYIICDWKRSKEIKYTNPYESGKGPLKMIDHCNYWHYCLQLNLYRYFLETHYSMTISQMFLVVLHPNQETYQKIDLPKRDDLIKLILNHRREMLCK
jgi:hypothetical protein